MSTMEEIIRKKESGGFFSSYIDSKEIGSKIFDSFKKMYVENKGYPIDNVYNYDKFGIISNVMALSTVLELEDMNVDMGAFDKEIFGLLELILNAICPYGSYVFDASPYIFNNESKEINITSYVETISKVIILITDMRTFVMKRMLKNSPLKVKVTLKGKNIATYNELLMQIEEALISSIKAINSACLEVDEKKVFKINGKPVERIKLDSEIRYRGWAFQAPKDKKSSAYETSIYYTYHATNAFLSFYQEFDEFFDFEFEKKPYNTNIKGTGSVTKKKFELDKQFFYDNFNLINEFRGRTISSGRYVDSLLKENNVDFAFDYIKSDFTPINVATVLDSQKNNYAIDTLFVLALLINAGIDDDYNEAGQLEYFYDQMQYSLMNVRKIYSIMKKNNNEDLVSSYRLMFNEKCPVEYKTLIQEFRKKCTNIAVYDLVPLLCNTSSIISKFLVRYPQKEMVDNLELIMENKFKDDVWLWDKDGFNANNNLYYIFAIENFYDYYEEFELPLSENGKEYNKIAKMADDEKNEKIHDLATLEREYEILKRDIENKKSNLDNEVYNIASQVFENKIEEGVDKYFKGMIKDVYRFLMEIPRSDGLKDNVLDDFGKAELLFKMSFAVNSPKILNQIEEIRYYADENKKFMDIDRKIKDEILTCLENARSLNK